MEYSHYSVLLEESIEALNIKPDGIYVDATTGGGGHSSRILEKLKSGHLYCFDQDDYALKRSEERLAKINSNFTLIKANFSTIKAKLAELGVTEIDGIIYDLGVSSFQLDIPERGFSYNHNAILDMRMDQSAPLMAKDVVNNYSYADLVRILYMYGDEVNAKKIANGIVNSRPINTTFELVDVIKKSLPQKVLRQKGHPAKLTFQALRIEVNKELEVLEKSLRDVITILKPNGILAVITFQPTEDKIVKHIFKEASTINVPKSVPIKDINAPFRMLTRKPILPKELELDENHRSHSAKLRVLVRNE